MKCCDDITHLHRIFLQQIPKHEFVVYLVTVFSRETRTRRINFVIRTRVAFCMEQKHRVSYVVCVQLSRNVKNVTTRIPEKRFLENTLCSYILICRLSCDAVI